MSLWQQLVRFADDLGRAFDQQVSNLPGVGPLFSSKWNLVRSDLSGGFTLLRAEGSQQIPGQVAASSITGRTCLRLATGLGQLRDVRLPEAAANDPASAIALMLDTLSPIAPEDIAYCIQAVTPLPETGQINVQVALTSKTRLAEVVAKAKATGLRVDAVDISNAKTLLASPLVDLASGKPARQGMRPAFLLVGLCGLLLSAALVLNGWASWQLEPQSAQLVRQTIPAGFSLAKTQRDERLARLSVTQTWDQVTQSLPDSAWADSLSIDKTTLRLAGHAQNAAALVSALEASSALQEVRLAAASVQEENNQESFDLQATIRAAGETP
ncbi:hypothetical protein MNBD_ALPHA06-2221 [hydrothermal vent metagenome]|uniref:General secretion pathway protein L n=1 Tax=hydrothermal vent metagenome TaxID=652676 RepID=A0A3B0S5A4_9ZZZZ